MSEFTAFPSIPRLMRDVVVTEKIDGTNAQVHVLEDGTVLAGSRNRYVTPGDDNFGFARWVKEHEDELRDGLGIGQHFGEWYGSGIQRGYGLTNGEKRFALFNTARWGDALVRPPSCDVVPVLYTGVLDTIAIDKVMMMLDIGGSVAVPGFAKPEGIVIFHTKSRQLYKYTLDKNDAHKAVA